MSGGGGGRYDLREAEGATLIPSLSPMRRETHLSLLISLSLSHMGGRQVRRAGGGGGDAGGGAGAAVPAPLRRGRRRPPAPLAGADP